MTVPRVPTSLESATRQDLVGEQYSLLGTSFQVWSTSTQLHRRVHRLLVPFSTPLESVEATTQFLLRQDPPDGFCSLLRDGKQLLSSAAGETVINLLLSELNREALNRFVGFAVHAGVVSAGGKVLAFPGASGCGKSTMVAACLRAGMSYVSDEALCYDPERLRIVPYPRPIRLSTSAGQAPARPAPQLGSIANEVNVTADDLGAAISSPPLNLAHVVRLTRRPGPDVLTEVAPAEAAAWLLRLSFNHYKQPDRNFWLVTEMARRIRAWSLEYEDAARGAFFLRERLGV